MVFLGDFVLGALMVAAWWVAGGPGVHYVHARFSHLFRSDVMGHGQSFEPVGEIPHEEVESAGDLA